MFPIPFKQILTVAVAASLVVMTVRSNQDCLATNDLASESGVYKVIKRDKSDLTGASALGFLSGGKEAFVIWDKSIENWDVKLWRRKAIIAKCDDTIEDATYSYDKNIFASRTVGGVIQLWDLQRARELKKFEKQNAPIRGLDFSPNGEIFGFADSDGRISLWNIKAARSYATFAQKQEIYCIRFFPDGKTIVSGNADGSVSLWDVPSKKKILSFPAHGSEILSLLFAREGKMLVTGSFDGSIKLWDLSQMPPKNVKFFRGQNNRVITLLASPNGGIMTSIDDKSVNLWDLKSLKYLGKLKPHNGRIEAIAFSHDGKLFLSADGHEIRLWDAQMPPFSEPASNKNQPGRK